MSGESPNIVDLLQSGLVDYVFSTSAKGRDPKRDSRLENGFMMMMNS